MVIVSPLFAGTAGVTGSITADRTTVLAESIVNVTWAATYPAVSPTEVVTIPAEPSETVIPKVKLRADVRCIGVAFGPSSSPYPVRGYVKSGTSSTWTKIFFGNANTYNPQTVIWSKTLNAGEALDFQFQGSQQSNYSVTNESSVTSWNTAINTTSSSPYSWNRVMLKNGDTAPSYVPAFDQANVKAMLSAYFKSGTSQVSIGPRDLIYLTELTNYNKGSSSTDMQDLIFLVTFTEI